MRAWPLLPQPVTARHALCPLLCERTPAIRLSCQYPAHRQKQCSWSGWNLVEEPRNISELFSSPMNGDSGQNETLPEDGSRTSSQAAPLPTAARVADLLKVIRWDRLTVGRSWGRVVPAHIKSALS